MANRSQPFRQHHLARALRAARDAGVTNPRVEVRLPGGAQLFVGGGEVKAAPKKHTTAAVARPPPTRPRSPSRRGG
jgi:hypothetical protein